MHCCCSVSCCYQEAIFWWISWKSETIQIYLRSLFHQNPSLFNKILQGAITFEIIARILNEAGDLFKIQLNFMIIFWRKFLTLFIETRFYDFQIFWSWRLCLEDSLYSLWFFCAFLVDYAYCTRPIIGRRNYSKFMFRASRLLHKIGIKRSFSS